MTEDLTSNYHQPIPKKLFGFLSSKAVRAMQDANDWIEAAHLVGDLLVKSGDIKPSYIEAMIRVIKEVGPYPVIAPGIVFLHARPEDGVINPAIGLVTLKTPVPFGHSENDPVDIVFAFGPVDKKNHIEGLQLIAEFLSEENSAEILRKPGNDDELFEVFRSWAENHNQS